MVQDGAFCILKIAKMSKDLKGVYKCVATNSVGTAETKCTAEIGG